MKQPSNHHRSGFGFRGCRGVETFGHGNPRGLKNSVRHPFHLMLEQLLFQSFSHEMVRSWAKFSSGKKELLERFHALLKVAGVLISAADVARGQGMCRKKYGNFHGQTSGGFWKWAIPKSWCQISWRPFPVSCDDPRSPSRALIERTDSTVVL